MAALMEVRPVTLTGRFVRLEPLSEAHVSGLAAIGMDDSIWQFMPYGYMRSEGDIQGWVRGMLAHAAAGTDIPFAAIDLASGCVAGATRYMEIRPAHRGLEIGGTWYGAQYRRTHVNTECKYLLLEHAFERLQCIRVQLKTDSRNERSQRAIERLGAVREGMLRNHLILPDGHVRHSIYYSILDSEWPSVKARLQQMLSR
ncbi:MAG TPA: GNAT family protein [Anaerolineales bacterium]|nr:GNAT family protein [Anaerolineales bacterium]